MKIADTARIAMGLALLVLSTSPGVAFAQQEKAKQRPDTGALVVPGSATIESINLDYERQVQAIERTRLASIGRLAQGQPKDQAAITLESYFRLAIAKNLYADAAPLAQKTIQAGGQGPTLTWLAYLVSIVAEAERGAYEDSLKGLASAIRLKDRDPAKAVARDASLSVGTQAAILEAYYQRLIHADQIDVARKAMKLIFDNAEAPPVRDLAGRRLKQLDLVGKPAPTIAGVDLEGKPFKLAETKGEVVLVVFWATWCLPNAQEMPFLDYVNNTYKAKGLRVVGVNLDAAQDGAAEMKTVLPAINRYLLDYNVTWPTLLNGPGERDYASAFGVTEIPASVLIGRDGKISHLDLMGRKLEKAITEALAQKP